MILLLSVLIIFQAVFYLRLSGRFVWPKLLFGDCSEYLWRPLRWTVLTGFGSLGGLPSQRARSTFNHRAYASNPWIYFQSYPHGSAPHQPDPPSSLACCLPRVSVVSTSCSSLVVVSTATINTPSQTDISSEATWR
ncbi:hypothetical protein Bca52824_094865 [Brassica carinata]|uniref:Uncharacterized protein n=1 Tax=Brassica carinata TaxID=52824 RepID=A0A8X7P1D2_BRACI|nr:hypothetical protein Bca52824_094865 [Brassica carinata]